MQTTGPTSKSRTTCADISHVPDQEILSRLEQPVKSERRITHQVLCHILEVEARKLHLRLHCSSVYQYLTKHLGYSENQAYDRLQAARILKSVPNIAKKIEEGSLNLTQLVNVDQSLKQEKRAGHSVTAQQTQQLLSRIENKTNYETAKIIACELNQAPVTHQKIRPNSICRRRTERICIKSPLQNQLN